jgi:hypothetical protein
MALQVTINPYAGLAIQWQLALVAAGTGTPANMSVINTNTSGNLLPQYFPILTGPPGTVGTPTTQDNLAFAQPELISAMARAENGFINSNLRNGNISSTHFNLEQIQFIAQLLDSIKNIPVQSIGDLIADIEDNISKSGLSSMEQAPLLMATMVGAKAYTYWTGIVQTPAAPFNAYINANMASTMQIYLIGYQLQWKALY